MLLLTVNGRPVVASEDRAKLENAKLECIERTANVPNLEIVCKTEDSITFKGVGYTHMDFYNIIELKVI